MRQLLILTALAALGSGVLSAGKPGATLTPAESRALVAELEQARAILLSRVAGLSDEQWSYKPGPDRWSAGEVLEHIYRAEAGHLALFDQLIAGEPAKDWRETTAGRSEMFTQIVPDRSRKAQAPPPLQPDRQMSRRDLVSAYLETHSAMIERAKDLETPYRRYVSDSPLGASSIADWLHFTSLHTDRHAAQIDEVFASPGFPE